MEMAMKWIIPVAGLVVLGSAALPAQSAPLGIGKSNTVEPSAVQQAHYGYYRHHRYYRYYREPYFYYTSTTVPPVTGIGVITATGGDRRRAGPRDQPARCCPNIQP